VADPDRWPGAGRDSDTDVGEPPRRILGLLSDVLRLRSGQYILVYRCRVATRSDPTEPDFVFDMGLFGAEISIVDQPIRALDHGQNRYRLGPAWDKSDHTSILGLADFQV